MSGLISDIVIKSVGDLVTVAKEAGGELKNRDNVVTSDIWFRGQPGPSAKERTTRTVTKFDADEEYDSYKLLPSIYRYEFMGNSDYPLWFREKELTNRFRHGAIGRQQGLPHLDEWVHWLCIMAHHGLPTRVLDWTESILVAAFFALENEPEEGDAPPIIWALNHLKLRKAHAIDSKKMNHFQRFEDDKKPAILEHTFTIGAGENQKASKEPHPNVVFSAGFPQYHQRMVVQKSVFTIHSGSDPEKQEKYPKAIEELDNAETFLRGFFFDKSKRNCILKELERIGISRSMLFPDLDNLAKDLMSKMASKKRHEDELSI